MEILSAIRSYVSKVAGKLPAALKTNVSKEGLIFVAFLLMSFFFWMLQAFQDTSDYTLKVPLHYETLPAHITITNELPKQVEVRLQDRVSTLYSYYRHRKEMQLDLNLMDWYRGEGVSKVPTGVLESRLRARLNPTTRILSLHPDTLPVYFVEKASKEVSIRLNHSLVPASQYMFTIQPRVQPSTVQIFAPPTVLNHVEYVETELLEKSEIMDSIQLNVALKPIKGVQFAFSTVRVLMKSEAFTEQTLSIPVQGLGFPEGDSLLSFPKNVDVTFFVCLSDFKNMHPDSFQLVVDYKQIAQSKSKLQQPKLIRHPERIRNIRMRPSQVDCLIEKQQ